jgi:hypothetical protein
MLTILLALGCAPDGACFVKLAPSSSYDTVLVNISDVDVLKDGDQGCTVTADGDAIVVEESCGEVLSAPCE